MSGYNKFLERVYSEEVFTVDPNEVEAINRMMAEEGYTDWSADLDAILLAQEEAKAWEGAKPVTLDDGAQVLIKKACEHSKCPLYKCNRSDLRIGGIDI